MASMNISAITITYYLLLLLLPITYYYYYYLLLLLLLLLCVAMIAIMTRTNSLVQPASTVPAGMGAQITSQIIEYCSIAYHVIKLIYIMCICIYIYIYIYSNILYYIILDCIMYYDIVVWYSMLYHIIYMCIYIERERCYDKSKQSQHRRVSQSSKRGSLAFLVL